MGLNQVNWNKEREKLGDSFPQLRAIEYDNKKIYIFDTLKWSIPFDVNTSITFIKEEVENVFNFAFNSKGNHRETRTGGQASRNEVQRFFNIFLGKLGEVATFNHFIKNNVNLKTKVDYEIRERGQWDDCDMVTEDNKYISIKSSKFYSNMLLLEKNDYNEKGELIYNLNKNKISSFDYFTYIRIAPIKIGCKKIEFSGYGRDFKQNTNDLKLELFNFIQSFDWVYEEPFIIEKKFFVDFCIKNNYYVEANNLIKFDEEGNVLLKLSKRKNSLEEINNYIEKIYNTKGGFTLDADNYYFPLKYMKRIKDLFKQNEIS